MACCSADDRGSREVADHLDPLSEKRCFTSLSKIHPTIHMTPLIQVKGLESDGIMLMSCTDSAFDAAVKSWFAGNVAELLALKPLLVCLSNQSGRTMVAYTLRWEIMRNGQREITFSQAKYPDAVAAAVPVRGNEVRAGERIICGMSIELDSGQWTGQATEEFYLRQFAAWSREYDNAASLSISLDAVIFEDGELIGPDESRLRDDFAAYVSAKQDLYHSLVNGLDSGRSMAEVFHPVEEEMRTYPYDRLRRDPLALYQRLAIEHVSTWRQKHEDGTLSNALRAAIRKEPFVIRRRME